jgi:hypothetical protein
VINFRGLFITLGVAVLALLAVIANAQAAETAVVTWTAPTADTNGSPLPSGATLTYSVYRAATASGTFVLLASGITGLSYSDTAATGAPCYYVTATQSGGGVSANSNTACLLVPNAPGTVTVTASTTVTTTTTTAVVK